MAGTVKLFTSRSPGNAAEKKTSIAACLAQETAPIVFKSTPQVVLNGSVAATGSGLSTGAPISAGSNKVTGATGTTAVVLPSTVNGSGHVFVWNSNASNALPVYPNTSTGTINGGSAGAALSVPANTSCVLIPIDNTDDWYSIPKTPS